MCRAKTLFAVMFLLVVCTVAPCQSVKTDRGRVRGITVDGVTSFKGIPYAAPPIGELRWRPPQQAARWDDTRAAIEFGHDCMQKPFARDPAILTTTPSEDCLFANIWRPAHSSGKLPILIWIHGGGWVNGGSSAAIYDGSQFARQGVLFFSFNYRLGQFGFFAHPALTAEHNHGLLGNYGYMDQIAAIKWIRKNAAAFGGDPNKVTVVGQSAGGYAVHVLMTSSLSKGLFQRAIIESGGGRTLVRATGLHKSANGRPSAEAIGAAFAETAGISGDGPEALSKLRALPAEALVQQLDVSTAQVPSSHFSGPIIDGSMIPGETANDYLTGRNRKIPLLIGANDMDLAFPTGATVDALFRTFGPDAAIARKRYDPSGSATFGSLRQAVGADALMLEPARFIARTLTYRGVPVWEYRFSYVATSLRPKLPGASHGSEIPYVFDTVESRYGLELSIEDKRVAKQANAYWTNFVKTGDPNGIGLPHWPTYDLDDDCLLNFTPDRLVASPDPRRPELDLTEKAASR
ncbi:carboxylesterase/lipase family protein [Terriglobus tenax]|uniref:carboxylesterase/lipase family protein n=1 Tax=Terriglobus tenax TaxID=1111115 RepID=UPI00295A674A|nr:carboxylesterase family protein [Terriglobus tenax]